ncbi:unnamed protein product [Adineta ricciae]|uniref:G-protein coupled receptors family 1 profile domain-containing protein n=1 Tax=Adineta ricciae TaxID=249248 RepID=A0A813WYM5_ADIRI|nr:unnamed protein product [Adineta ricciae]CAF1430815.1 unnamed protein product [Adineta ricciae]
MSNSTSQSIEYNNADSFTTSGLVRLKFSILLALEIPSVVCSLSIFLCFIRLSELRAKQHNHVVICLLISNFLTATTEIPISLTYLYNNEFIPPSNSLCFLWIFSNYIVFGSSFWIMVTASIQRYILIFYKYRLNTKFKHYFPIVFPPAFFTLWYIILICFYPCQQQFDYSQLWCSGACYGYQGLISSIDWIISSLMPVLIIVITNVVLILSVGHQKYRMQRARTWRTTRKLVIQLLPISFVYLIIYVPVNVFALIRLWFDPSFLLDFYMNIFAYFNYFGPLLMPFVCLMSMPEITAQLKNLYCFSNRVQPQRIRFTASAQRVPQQTN